MLRWKNKSIDELTTEELRQALGEAVYLTLSDKNSLHNNDIVFPFLTGIVLGTMISVFGTLLALTV